MAKGSLRATFICDECGNKFQEELAGVELDGHEITCPACGYVDRIDEKLAQSIIAQVEVARGQFVKDARKELEKGFRRAARGSKHVKYRPK